MKKHPSDSDDSLLIEEKSVNSWKKSQADIEAWE